MITNPTFLWKKGGNPRHSIFISSLDRAAWQGRDLNLGFTALELLEGRRKRMGQEMAYWTMPLSWF
jgi:hypothetical protein